MTLTLRAATQADAGTIAALANAAGGGFPASVWSGQAEFGQDPMVVGRRRALEEDELFSWRNTLVAEADGRTAGMLLVYRTPHEPVAVDAAPHPMLRPIVRLINEGLDTCCISFMATLPAFRGQGVGSALLERAETRPGPRGMSVILSDTNTTARHFYTHRGYREVRRLPVVRADWKTDTAEWVLYRKP